MNGGFGGAIEIMQVGTIKTLSYILLQRGWNGLATAHNMLEPGLGFNIGIGQEGLEH